MKNSCNQMEIPGLNDLSFNLSKSLGLDNVLGKVDKTNETVSNVNQTVNEIMDKSHDNLAKIKPYAIGVGVLLGTLWTTDILRNIKEIRK